MKDERDLGKRDQDQGDLSDIDTNVDDDMLEDEDLEDSDEAGDGTSSGTGGSQGSRRTAGKDGDGGPGLGEDRPGL